jgi:hypothetical protein
MIHPLQKSYFEDICKKLINQKRIKVIDRLQYLSRKNFFTKYANLGYPVIFKTKAGLSRITFEEFSLLLPTEFKLKTIDVRPSVYKKIEDYSIHRVTQKMTLVDFLENFRNESTKLIGYAANNKLSDEELSFFNILKPKFYTKTLFQSAKLWIGASGVETPLHADGLDNFVLQLSGQKLWTIFPVRDYPHLSMFVPKPDTIPNFYASKLDLRKFHELNGKQITRAKSIIFTLRAGETLYIPAGWAHYVKTIEDSIMINFWMKRDIEPAIFKHV